MSLRKQTVLGREKSCAAMTRNYAEAAVSNTAIVKTRSLKTTGLSACIAIDPNNIYGWADVILYVVKLF
jgi:hypothetical protein